MPDWGWNFLQGLNKRTNKGEFRIAEGKVRALKMLPEWAIGRLARETVRIAKRLAPRKSGQLAGNLKAERKARKGQVFFLVFSRTLKLITRAERIRRKERKKAGEFVGRRRGHSVSVEFGHRLRIGGKIIRKVAAKPYLRPARQQVANQAGTILRGTWEEQG